MHHQHHNQKANYNGNHPTEYRENRQNQSNQQHHSQPHHSQSHHSQSHHSQLHDKPQFNETKQGISILGDILAKISFCDKQCSNINDNKVKAAVVKHLETQYNIQIISRDYTIINPNNQRIVSYHQHVLTPFTNGNAYLLYLTKIDGINCCIYIDRKLKDGYTYPKMHCVKYNFQDELFGKETIFAGELVKDNQRRWFFLVDNILLYKGMSTLEKNVIGRFELIHNILGREYTLDKFLEICPLKVKRLFLYKDVKRMVEDFIPNLSYVCKGIIFYTLNSRCSNFAFLLPRESQFEVKSPNEIDEIVQEKYPKLWAKKHSIMQENITDALDIATANATIDIYTNTGNQVVQLDNIVIVDSDNVVFKILKTDIPDIYNLYCLDKDGSLYKHSIALVPNIKISHYLYNTFKSNPNNLNMRVECRFSKVFEKWTPIRFVGNEPYQKDEIEKREAIQKNE
jgi:hypothetical protein